MSGQERVPCPSCGGAGGGPFGPAASAWDDEDWVCPRCKGVGVVLAADLAAPPRPGIVKAVEPAVPAQRKVTKAG